MSIQKLCKKPNKTKQKKITYNVYWEKKNFSNEISQPSSSMNLQQAIAENTAEANAS